MLRRNSTARRRLGSGDLMAAGVGNCNTTSGDHQFQHNSHNAVTGSHYFHRSRSQERSLNRRSKGRGGTGSTSPTGSAEDTSSRNIYEASSTAGSIDRSLEELDPLDYDEEPRQPGRHRTPTCSKLLVGGVFSPSDNRVILTTTTPRSRSPVPPSRISPMVRRHKTNNNNKKTPSSSTATTATTSSSHYHRRAQSDPFDISGLEEPLALEDQDNATTTIGSSEDDDSYSYLSEVEEGLLVEQHVQDHLLLPPLPTLPRYPVAETRDLHCWSESSITAFRVRGRHYLTDKKKCPSAPYLLRARGCDLFLLPEDNNGNNATAPQEPVSIMERSTSFLNGTLRKEPTLVLNFRFPWGLMLLYFEIPAKLVPFLQQVPPEQRYKTYKNNRTTTNKNNQQQPIPLLDSLSPGERTLALWFMGDANYKNQRLKLIPYVVQGPWVVRNLVTGKPAIIGTKLPVTYQYHSSTTTTSSMQTTNAGGSVGAGDTTTTHHHNHNNQDLFVADLDIGNSSATAKRIVSVCRRYMNALTCDIGFVIQGNTPLELPEQMLGSIRIHGIDPLKAPTFQ